MNRSKKILFVSHCILNQNSVVKDLAKKQSHFNAFLKPYLDQEVGFIQLPCPELLYGGLNRPHASFEDYDNKSFRSVSRNSLQSIVYQLKHYLENGYECLGIVGIKHSPSCGVFHTVFKENDQFNKGNGSGVFMEELKSMLQTENIEIPFMEV